MKTSQRTRRVASVLLAVSTMLGASCGDDDQAESQAPSTSEDTPAADPDDSTTGSSAATDASLDELVAAAQEEGSLTFYTAATENIATRVVDAFNEEYGIEAEFVRLSSTQLQQRYAAEADAGNIQADLIFNAGNATAFAEDQTASGNMYSIQDAELPVLASGDFPHKYVRGPNALIQIAPWQFAYNTGAISEDDAPTTWEDLLDPEFKDMILIPDPTASDAYFDVWKVVLDNYGEEYFDALRDQGIRFVESGVPAMEALSAGEASIVVPVVPSQALANVDQGAPIGVSVPDDTSAVEMTVGLTDPDKAEHPNAARLLANFVMSEEGNRVFNDDPGNVGVYDGGGLPTEYVAPSPDNLDAKDQITELLGV